MGNDNNQKELKTKHLNTFVCGNILDLLIDKSKVKQKEYQGHIQYTHPDTLWYFTEVLENEVTNILEKAINNNKRDEENLVVILPTKTIFCNEVYNMINAINQSFSVYHPFLLLITDKQEKKEQLIEKRKEDFEYFDQRNLYVIHRLYEKDTREIYMRLFKICSYYNQLGDEFYFPLSVNLCNMLDENDNEVSDNNNKEINTQKQKKFSLFENNFSHRINFLIMGRPGTGKSSLINKILGEKRCLERPGKTATIKILKYNHPQYPIGIYDTPGFENKAGMEETFDLLKKMNKKLNEQLDIIHMAIYMINSQDRTLYETEIEFLQRITQWSKDEFDKDINYFNKRELPLIFVLTHGITKKKGQRQKVILNRDLKKIFNYEYSERIFSVELFAEDGLPSFGMGNLFDYINTYFEQDRITLKDSLEKLTNNQEAEIYGLVKTSRLLSKIRSKEEIKRFCRYSALGIITSTVAVATAIGASPIPFADWFLITSIQVSMIIGIGVLYSIQFSKNEALNIIKSLALAGVASGVCRAIASSIKVVPGIGTITGIVIDTVVSATGTAGIGWATIQICEKKLDEIGVKDFYLKAIDEYNYALDSFVSIKNQFSEEYKK